MSRDALITKLLLISGLYVSDTESKSIVHVVMFEARATRLYVQNAKILQIVYLAKYYIYADVISGAPLASCVSRYGQIDMQEI